MIHSFYMKTGGRFFRLLLFLFQADYIKTKEPSPCLPEWFNEDDEMHVAKQFIDIPITENTRLHFETNKDGITTLYADVDGDGTDDQNGMRIMVR